MKTFLLIFVLASLSIGRAEEVVLGDTKSLHQLESYVWTVSTDRIAKLPLWKKDDAPPLSPQRAEEIAFAWTRRQEIGGFIPARPYVISLVQFPAPFDERYFYKVHFSTTDGRDSFWTVHILLDGSIVEPTKKGAEPRGRPNRGVRPSIGR